MCTGCPAKRSGPARAVDAGDALDEHRFPRTVVPHRAVTWSSGTSRSTSVSAWTAPKFFDMPRSSRRGTPSTGPRAGHGEMPRPFRSTPRPCSPDLTPCARTRNRPGRQTAAPAFWQVRPVTARDPHESAMRRRVRVDAGPPHVATDRRSYCVLVRDARRCALGREGSRAQCRGLDELVRDHSVAMLAAVTHSGVRSTEGTVTLAVASLGRLVDHQTRRRCLAGPQVSVARATAAWASR